MSSKSNQLILDASLSEYVKNVGIDPANHPFADRLQTCHSSDDVLKLLEDKANEFKDYREGNRKLIDCLKPVVNVIHAVSDVLGEAVRLVPFQPAKAIFVGVNILFSAASGVSSSYDGLVDLFECVGSFLKYLRIYADIYLTPSMMETSVKIMVELLSVLALATKQIKEGRFKKKKILGEREIEAVLQRLDCLPQEEGQTAVAQTLELVHGLMNTVKVLMDGDMNSYEDEGWPPLYLASLEGHVNIVEFFIQNGADVNQKTDNQETPLHAASENGKLEIVQILVERGADVHSREKDGWTPLKTASYLGHLDVVRFLIDKGADVNAYDYKGWTPLHLASLEGHVNIVEVLIRHDADVNQQTYDQDTPLDVASANGELEASRLLVLHGASVQSRDKNGCTPLEVASHFGYLDVARFLIDNGADVNSHDNEGWTPLHAAADEGQVGIVELLLARGADFSVRGDENKTPLDLASKGGHLAVARSLIEPLQLAYDRITEQFKSSSFGEPGQGITVQGAPTQHPERASHLKMLEHTPVPVPSTQFATDITTPATTSVSLQRRCTPTSPPSGATRVTCASPTLPEASNPSPRLIPVPGEIFYSTALHADDETACQARNNGDFQREKSVGNQLQMMIDSAASERNKAVQTAQWTGGATNTTIATQVLIGAVATALGVALSGNTRLIAISFLCGASILVVSYLVLVRGSNEHRASLLRVKAFNHFLREIEVLKLDHGHKFGRDWDEKVNGFRLGLENMLKNRPGSSTIINSKLAGSESDLEEGVGITNPVQQSVL